MIVIDEEKESLITAAYCREIARTNAAVETAKAYRNDVNCCQEYERAFVFFNTEDQPTDGGNSPVAILKSNGEAVQLSSCHASLGEFIRQWKC